MNFPRSALLMACLLLAACSKTLQGTYETPSAKAGTFRFEPNGMVTMSDSKGNKIFTLPYSKNDAIITIDDPQHHQEFKQIDRNQLETKGPDGATLIYKRQ